MLQLYIGGLLVVRLVEDQRGMLVYYEDGSHDLFTTPPARVSLVFLDTTSGTPIDAEDYYADDGAGLDE